MSIDLPALPEACQGPPFYERAPDNPKAVFEEPILVEKTEGRPTRLRENAVLARRIYAVWNVGYLSAAPIVAGGTVLALPGRLFTGYRWKDRNAACLVRRHQLELGTGIERLGLCVSDTNGDGLMDVAHLEAGNFAIDPVELVRVKPLQGDHKLSFRFDIDVRAVQVNKRSFRLIQGLKDTPGHMLPTYTWSVRNSADWNVVSEAFPLEAGGLHRFGASDFRIGRSRKAWTVTFAGLLSPPAACRAGLAVGVERMTLRSP